MPLVQTRGAASAQGFGEFAQATVANYIEDVFSTYLYTGTGATQTITNNIDLSTKGGLVWTKARYLGISHRLVDTARGATYELSSDTTDASSVNSTGLTSFGTTGYTIGSAGGYNNSGGTYVSWTFRKQPKFFDVVTWTGNSTAGRTVAHNLGSVPAVIIVKRIDGSASNWCVYHRSAGNSNALLLNTTGASASEPTFWNSTTPTESVFSLGTSPNVNYSGLNYVAYLFAHDAGGFGLTGTDNVISCGSFTTDGSGNATVSLGYEPQWVMLKASSTSGNWEIDDTFRGMPVTGSIRDLIPNSSAAEGVGGALQPSATGFYTAGALGGSTTYIYIAIRRGPMKVPTLGTSVFKPVTYSGNGSNDRLVNTTITPDLFIDMRRENIMDKYVLDRLRGNAQLYSNLTSAESTNTAQVPTNTFNVNQTGVTVSADELNTSGRTYVLEAFKRAPGFFDEVCYTGTGTTNRSISHNLQAAPELLIIKTRNAVGSWATLTKFETSNYVELNLNSASEGSVRSYVANQYISSKPSSTVFTVNDGYTNTSAETYVAYLFATCANVSKVGSYTGTGTTQTINCGFTGGARFVLIKRYDPDFSGDWYVWDSARGIIAGNDPYLLLNTTAAEVTNTDYIDTAATGFEISSTAPAAINASAGSFIFFAVS